MSTFKIDVTDLKWIGEITDDPRDLCLHGKVTAQIGKEVIENHGTVSATALYLLRSLTEDHNTGEDNQMIPCCGHFMIANEDMTHVDIVGYPFGTDWKVEQIPEGVKITTESGTQTHIAMDDYRREVYRFVDQIEDHYNRSKPKQPYDDFERKGYWAFWNEWHRRRSE